MTINEQPYATIGSKPNMSKESVRSQSLLQMLLLAPSLLEMMITGPPYPTVGFEPNMWEETVVSKPP